MIVSLRRVECVTGLYVIKIRIQPGTAIQDRAQAQGLDLRMTTRLVQVQMRVTFS